MNGRRLCVFIAIGLLAAGAGCGADGSCDDPPVCGGSGGTGGFTGTSSAASCDSPKDVFLSSNGCYAWDAACCSADFDPTAKCKELNGQGQTLFFPLMCDQDPKGETDDRQCVWLINVDPKLTAQCVWGQMGLLCCNK